MKFEHHVTCIEKRDLNENQEIDLWLKEISEYMKANLADSEIRGEK